jgi:hypothetical protein
VLLSTWDTPADAREFADAYARRSALRYGIPQAPIGPTPWHTREGDLAIDQRGSRVAIIEGIPARADAAALMAMLWR